MEINEKKNSLIEKSLKNDLEECVNLLSKGLFGDALEIYNSVLNKNPASWEGEAGFRTTKFWQNRIHSGASAKISTRPFRNIIEYWGEYERYADKHKMVKSLAHQGILQFVYKSLTYAFPNTNSLQVNLENDFKTITKVGEIFIKMEDWANATFAFETARAIKREDAHTLSLLGESYYQNKNIHRGLVMLREAFFVNPRRVPVDLLKSEPIQQSIKEMEDAGIRKEHQIEWLAVFATLYGFFPIKRSLSRKQLEELNQNTIKLEEAHKNNNDHSHILPRLINHYLWLLDYYLFQEEDKTIRDQILGRIKTLDSRMHEILINTYRIL